MQQRNVGLGHSLKAAFVILQITVTLVASTTSQLVKAQTIDTVPFNSYQLRKHPIKRTPWGPLEANTAASIFLDIDNDGVTEYLGIGITEDYHWALMENNRAAGEASPDVFTLYRRDENCYEKECLLEDEDIKLDNRDCLHARKSIIGDFNQDGFMDVVVACHGWDKAPFPGSQVVALINNDGKGFSLKTLPFSGYWHSIASADFNGDGLLDLVLADAAWRSSSSLDVYLNDGSFNFSKDDSYIKTGWGGVPKAFTLSVPDINSDGLFDLFIAGNKFAHYILNNGQNTFALSDKVTLPTTKDFPYTYDILVHEENLFLLKVEAKHKGSMIEKIDPLTMDSEVVFKEICPFERVWDDPCDWQRWLYTEVIDNKLWLVSDNKRVNPQKILLD